MSNNVLDSAVSTESRVRSLPRRVFALLVLAVCAPAVTAAEPEPRHLEFFETKIRPLLIERCGECHFNGEKNGGLSLESGAAALQGGDSGAVIVPGKPDESLLVAAIRRTGDIKMPPDEELSAGEIADLVQWVKIGAPWPRGLEGVPAAESGFTMTPEQRAFWAFQPIQHPPVPPVRDASWPKNDLDRFVLAELERHGLKPSAPADRRTLIRRATFDLVGLPPTPDEVQAFVDDTSEDAFAKVVERLLASPHYGERWGRHWLDVARYAEDQAHTFQARLYPNGYRYRDWVVKSLNDDLPYDQFVVEQLAGDLLDGPGREDRLAALGFLAMGPVYFVDNSCLAKSFADERDDRIDTVSRGFLGLTVACARCHDHKYDPIPTRDYYALAGIFASTEYKEYPIGPVEMIQAYEANQAAIKAQTDQVNEFLKVEAKRLAESAIREASAYFLAAWTYENRKKTDPEASLKDAAKSANVHEATLQLWLDYLASGPAGRQPELAGWRGLAAQQDPQVDWSNDDAARAAAQAAADAIQADLVSLLETYQPEPEEPESPAQEPPPEDSEASSPEAADRGWISELIGKRGILVIGGKALEKVLPESAAPAFAGLQEELDRLKEAPPTSIPLVQGLADAEKPVNLKVAIRGNQKTLGDEAPRRFLSVLSDDQAPAFQNGSGRLELARAIASPQNPLTARVLVNRVWHQHFGRGLVATPSNFGRLGERPTHPELLDWLAGRFIAGGWSIKTLHREMLLSATYQLGTTATARGLKVDPEARLLWRMNRRRLDVEAWRDALLAVAGNLDPTLGGPSIGTPTVVTGPGSPPKKPDQPEKVDNHRRTLYGYISRHNLDGLLRLFDFPDPNITSDRRVATTVPLQQLYVLNSEFLIGQAKVLAARLTDATAENDAERVEQAYLLTFARPPRADEQQLALEFLSTGGGSDEAPEKLSRWEQFAQALLASNEFLYLD